MNAEFEVLDEPTTAPTVDVLPEETLDTLVEPTSLEQQLTAYRSLAESLSPQDQLSLKRVAALVETCKVASRHAEKRRHEVIDDAQKVVNDGNAVWIPIREGFDDIAKRKAGEAAAWIDGERKKGEERQRKEIEDKRREQEELERRAKAERDEAERLRKEAERLVEEEKERVAAAERARVAAERKQEEAALALIEAQRKGDEAAQREQEEAIQRAKDDEAERVRKDEETRLANEAEQARLAKEANKAESRGDKLELKSSNVVTDVVPMQAKTIDLGGSKLITKAPKKKWCLPGWEAAKPLRVTDPKLAALVGDMDALPEGVRFLLQHADLNHVHLNKSFGVIKFPAPFGEVDDYSGSALRTGK